MCFLLACEEEVRVIGSEKAPGNCPCCGGAVVATDVEVRWRLCCWLPLSLLTKRRFQCSGCSRRLVT